ncbi:MAG: hypothetical protein HUU08_16160 [Candidatus Brocadia sp.]|nr:hypothetical protein [Candidatus Brocadia sp.]
MNRTQSVDFHVNEFKNQNKDIQWLCHTIKKEGYSLGTMNAPENTVEWLNEILRHSEFFDAVIALKTSLILANAAKKLRDETASIRHKAFKDLSDNDQEAIKKLNRLTIELVYPRETPKSSYELVALIRTKRGSSFLQDYENIEDFKLDMKEHREDVDWGLLVRCDEGRIISDYFSELGDREKIGLVGTEPKSASVTPEGLNPQQAALREAAIKNFKSNKAKKFISAQMQYINASRQLGEAVSFLFDDAGRPPALAPLEDIVNERKKIEARIRWLEEICAELRNTLTKIKEIEDGALELLGQNLGKV